MSDDRDIASLLKSATAELTKAGVDGAGREARLLLQHAAGISISTQVAFAERILDVRAVAAFEAALARRLRREPLSHITGLREFWSLPFSVTADTLDPRPDSETLIESVLQEITASMTESVTTPLNLVDFGTGSGCLLLALLSELPAAKGVGIDANPGAVMAAVANAKQLGLAQRATFIKGNWDHNFAGCDAAAFDIVISNPPYIATSDIDNLQPEVALFEPRLALDGGMDGLTAYHSLAPVIMHVMKPNGFAAIEIGAGQAADVIGIMYDAGLQHRLTAHDLHDHERVLLFRKF